MIIDLIKNGEYRAFAMVTFIKDYLMMLLWLFGVLGMGLVVWSVVLLIDGFIIFYEWYWSGVVMRSVFIVSLIPPIYFHKRSHTLEKAKYNIKEKQ